MKTIALVTTLMLVVAVAIAQDKDTPEGKKVFLSLKCNTCHSIEAMGIPKKPNQKPPDLSDVGAKHSAQVLTDFLKKKAQIGGKKHIAPFKGDDVETATLTQWLSSLKPQGKTEEK